MAGTQRQTEPDLASPRGDFFQLLRLLEARGRALNACRPLGGDGPPGREAVQLRVHNSAAFPARTVERMRVEASTTTLWVNLLGLTGPAGVLPRHYSTLVQQGTRRRETALADFLDLFNHRLLSLYYRAWGKYRLPLALERAESAGIDQFSRALGALSRAAPDHVTPARLYYSGHYSRHTRSAAGLERILAELLGLPLRVESYAGRWLPIAAADRLRLGSAGRGRNHRLGDGLLAGRRAWDLQGTVRIHIGPLTHRAYETLLPGGEPYRLLHRLIDEYLPAQLQVELHWRIRDSAQRVRGLAAGTRPGSNCWLQSRTHHPLRAQRRLPRGAARWQETSQQGS